jgi:hypothetical protein
MKVDQRLSRGARALRALHSTIGVGELGCLGYVLFCGVARRRDFWLRLSVTVLAAEGLALVVARGCPLGVFQSRAGDDVPLFELWFGQRLAPFAIPTFTGLTLAGLALVVARPPGRCRHRPRPRASLSEGRRRWSPATPAAAATTRATRP